MTYRNSRDIGRPLFVVSPSGVVPGPILTVFTFGVNGFEEVRSAPPSLSLREWPVNGLRIESAMNAIHRHGPFS